MNWTIFCLIVVLACERVSRSMARRPRAVKQRQMRDDDDDEYGYDETEEDSEIDWSVELKKKAKMVGIDGIEEGEDDLPKKARSVTDFLHPPTPLNFDEDEVPRSYKRMFTKHFSKSDYLESHHFFTEGAQKAFPENEVLMYVTPWNRKGKEYVIRMNHKVNWVAPCWYHAARAIRTKTLW